MTKVAVITGSGGGLGKGIANRLAKDGFNIVLNDINQELLDETLEEFKKDKLNAIALKEMFQRKRTNSIWLKKQ